MDAALTALGRRPLEMLYNIRQINLGAINTCVGQRLIQKLPRRSDGGLSCAVFLVSGLFADEPDFGILVALSEHCLRRVLPKIARLAAARLPS